MSQALESHQLLRATEVARILACHRQTVYRLINSGELPAVRVGEGVRVRERDLRAYIDSRPVEASA